MRFEHARGRHPRRLALALLALGVIDVRDIAPTLARRPGLALRAADGRVLLP